MKKHSALLAALMLTGCVNMKAVPAGTEILKPYLGQPLTIITYSKPDFPLTTQKLALAGALSGTLGGIVGGNIAVNNGNAVVTEDGITDPAPQIGAKLSSLVQAALKPASVKTVTDLDPKQSDQAPFFKLAGNHGVIFDVQTISWQVSYIPSNTDRYRVMLTMRARLEDGDWGTLLARAPCTAMSADANAPSYDEMLANHGERLKTLLQAAADNCLATMQKMLLGD